MGSWVLEEACRQIAEWQDQQTVDPGLQVSVNISARQFRHKDLVREVSRVLSQTGLAPACLILEVTESLVMDDVSSTLSVLRELKALGVELAIDDFGTGYSSLSYLKRFPADYLKIDRSFIADLSKESGDAVIVEATTRLSHALGLQVIAEGVETLEQLVHLRKMGCEAAQGYYFSKPLPAKEISQMLKDRFPLAQR